MECVTYFSRFPDKPVLSSTPDELKFLKDAVAEVVEADESIPQEKKKVATDFTVNLIKQGFESAEITHGQLVSAVEAEAAERPNYMEMANIGMISNSKWGDEEHEGPSTMDWMEQEPQRGIIVTTGHIHADQSELTSEMPINDRDWYGYPSNTDGSNLCSAYVYPNGYGNYPGYNSGFDYQNCINYCSYAYCQQLLYGSTICFNCALKDGKVEAVEILSPLSAPTT